MNLLERLDKDLLFVQKVIYLLWREEVYLSAGAFVPEVVIEHPEVVTQLHREFIRAGSDVVQAFTYYGHREKLKIIGKEHLLEQLQKRCIRNS